MPPVSKESWATINFGCGSQEVHSWWCVIRIVHVRTNHWLCIRVSQGKAVVNIYDSKYASLVMTTVDLILEVIESEQDTVTINSIKMQEQVGCDACGVFAIAVATALCHNDDPTTIKI